MTGHRVYLRETIKGTDKAAQKRAESAMNALLTQIDNQRSTESSVSFGYALDEWMPTSGLEESTRNTYEGYIRRTIRPALGAEPAKKINARGLEIFYTELRRRKRCDGKPFIEKNKKDEHHDCAAEECKPHKCNPDGLVDDPPNPPHHQRHLGCGRPLGLDRLQPSPNSPQTKTETPRTRPIHLGRGSSIERSSLRDGRRLGPLGLTSHDNWNAPGRIGSPLIQAPGPRRRRNRSPPKLGPQTRERHQDSPEPPNRPGPETIVLLKEHKARVKHRVEDLGLKFTEDLSVFSASKTPDHSQPYSSNAITQRYKDMATRLDIDTHLHALRH